MHTLCSIYINYAKLNGFEVELLLAEPGKAMLRVRGKNVQEVFQSEAGKHSIHNMPKNQKKGKRQTSVAAVAVLPLPDSKTAHKLNEDDVEISYYVGQGAGGQHKNRTYSAVRAVHTPTKLMVCIDGRDQHQNKKYALQILAERVHDATQKKLERDYGKKRKKQLGDRGRADKIRTYDLVKSRVTDHRTGRQTNQVKRVLKGELCLVKN